jgi:hypothetical protein
MQLINDGNDVPIQLIYRWNNSYENRYHQSWTWSIIPLCMSRICSCSAHPVVEHIEGKFLLVLQDEKMVYPPIVSCDVENISFWTNPLEKGVWQRMDDLEIQINFLIYIFHFILYLEFLSHVIIFHIAYLLQQRTANEPICFFISMFESSLKAINHLAHRSKTDSVGYNQLA